MNETRSDKSLNFISSFERETFETFLISILNLIKNISLKAEKYLKMSKLCCIFQKYIFVIFPFN